MGAILQFFRELGQRRLVILAITGVVLTGLIIFISLRLTSPTMQPIYTDLSLDDSARIVSELEKSSIPYELRAGGTQVLVPSDQVLRLRLSLAQSGLPSGGSIVGYEIFDRNETMGTSSFVMNVNMMRALEGELSRTISSLSQVEAARVHLVVPKQEIFSRDKQDATASVVIKLRGTSELTKEQIGAITHLVAAAVPGLKPAKITLVDSSGRMLAGGNGDDNDTAASASTTQEYKLSYENRMKSILESLLEKSVGAGKVKVTVSADINFDRIVTNSETYDPNGQVARSVQTGEEREQSNEKTGKENTTAANNLPNAQANQTTNGSNRVVEKTDETTNYEISKTVQNHVQETGKINKLSVAVLVDGTYGEDKSGKQSYTPRSDEERKQLDTLVKSAIGYDEKRGDSVQIVNMRFIAAAEETAHFSIKEWLTQQDLRGIIQTIVFGGIGVLVLLLVIRPLVSRLLEATAGDMTSRTMAMAGAGAAAPGAATGQPAVPGAAPAPGSKPAPGLTSAPLMPVEEEPSIDIRRITGRVRSSLYNQLNELVGSNPADALGVLRVWSTKRS